MNCHVELVDYTATMTDQEYYRMAISTRDLRLLPDIPTLKRLSQSLALLDAILSPDWEYRYYSFNAQWAVDQAMASMRNGEGDSYVVWFSPDGAVLKGFAHESPMSPDSNNPPRIWPGVLDTLPPQLGGFLTETAFTPEETTFCTWRVNTDSGWHIGPIQFPDEQDPDGSASLLSPLDGKPQSYKQWAESYYERPVDLLAVTHIYEHKPLTNEIVTALNPGLSIQDLTKVLIEIGYGS